MPLGRSLSQISSGVKSSKCLTMPLREVPCATHKMISPAKIKSLKQCAYGNKNTEYQWLHLLNPKWNSPLLYKVLKRFCFWNVVNTTTGLLGSNNVMKRMGRFHGRGSYVV